jgi:hypothetical protein
MDTWQQRWRAYPRQIGIAFDQLVNALIPPFQSMSYADETLSARTWRAYRDSRVFGKVLMPLFDWMFFWQVTDPEILEDDGVTPIRGHCRRAYWKEVKRRNEPPEYREAAARMLADAAANMRRKA